MENQLDRFAGPGSSNVPATLRAETGFEALARRESSIDGELLRFKKGKWLVGEDKTPLPGKTRLIADMHQFFEGWTKWQDGHVVDRIVGRVEDGFIPPPRHALGDLDQKLWEIAPDGAKDPWVQGYAIALRYLDKPEAEQLVLNLATWGGRKCALKLNKAYIRRGLARRDKLPVVEIGVGYKTYEDYGDVAQPLLTIVDWVDDPEVETPSTNGAPAHLEAAATVPAQALPQPQVTNELQGDSIPF